MLTKLRVCWCFLLCSAYCLFPNIINGQCAPAIQVINSKLILNYYGVEVPTNLDKIDVDFPELTKDNINVVHVNTTWQTVGPTNFTGVTLTGDVAIYYTDGSTEVCSYTEGNLNGPLAVDLHQFRGSLKGNDVYLHWSTMSENQNAGFEVER